MPPPAHEASALSSFYLVADARERCVIPFLEDTLGRHALAVRQVTTGDYLVCQRLPDGSVAVRACIERKTLPDFASSLQDGRYGNVAKMLRLREATGCQLYFLVEGPAFPSPDRRFHRVPYASLLSAMDHLMVRDSVYVMQTSDEAHTAKRLADLVRAFDAVAPPPPPSACPVGDIAADSGAEEDAPPLKGDELTVPAILTASHEPSLEDDVTTVWASLRGVSLVFGRVLSRRFSLADLACGRVPAAALNELRSATGRAPPRDALASLRALAQGAPPQALRVVGALRGLSADSAAQVLEALGGLAGLCDAGASRLAQVELTQKGGGRRRLGLIKASRWIQVLTFCAGASSPEKVDAAGTTPAAESSARSKTTKIPRKLQTAPPAEKFSPLRGARFALNKEKKGVAPPSTCLADVFGESPPPLVAPAAGLAPVSAPPETVEAKALLAAALLDEYLS